MFENTLQYVTFADRSQVEGLTEYYDSLLLSSHLLIGGKKAVTSLLNKLNENGELKYYIDPAVTEFRLGTSFRDKDGDIRQWHQKLVDELGEPFTSKLEEDGNVVYSELSKEERQSAVESLCKLQEDFVADVVKESVGKYEKDVAVEGLQPERVIPWYEKIEDLDSLKTNESIIKKYEETSSLPLKPTVHVTQSYIRDRTNRRIIAEKCDELTPNDYFIWIDGLDKDSPERSFKAAIHLVAQMADFDLSPHFMYGDYFSNLLFFFGLRGTSYGTFYRESASEKVDPSPGGGNLQRFYIDGAHEFMSIPNAKKTAERVGASIPEHTEMTNWGDLYEFGKGHDSLKDHYVRTRYQHKQQLQDSALDDLLNDLSDSAETYKGSIESQNKSVNHILRWIEAINSFQEDYPELSERRFEDARRLETT